MRLSTLWNSPYRNEIVVAVLVSLILGGLLFRNVVDATTAGQALRAAAVVFVLASLFGYRIVSRHLDTQHDGALLLLVGGLSAGVLLAVAPSAFDAELMTAFGALALLGAALVVAPYVDFSTRSFGGVLVLTGVAMAVAGVVVFDDGVVAGGLVALLGVVTLLDPEGLEEFEREVER